MRIRGIKNKEKSDTFKLAKVSVFLKSWILSPWLVTYMFLQCIFHLRGCFASAMTENHFKRFLPLRCWYSASYPLDVAQ